MTKKRKREFKVGDRVCLTGVVETTSARSRYPVLVKWSDGDTDTFTEDGRFSEEIRPSLKHLKPKPPKKRMVTKTVERWLLIYPDGTTSISPIEPDCWDEAGARLVKLAGSYEVEE